LALAAASVTSGPSRREIVAAQLPVTAWPEKRVLIATVNADTGERRAFGRDSGIHLVDAVIASTASFGTPPVLFQGEHYIDGGFYCTDNADLAIGFDRVMILALKRPPGNSVHERQRAPERWVTAPEAPGQFGRMIDHSPSVAKAFTKSFL
jgi:hypothetical protein